MTSHLLRHMLSMMMLLSLAIPATAASEKFTLDSEHSYVLWKIKHFGFSTQTGKWYVKGFILLDKENPQNSKVDVTIDVAKIITGIPELDKHLTGPLFFDVAKFKTATFISDKVDVLGKNTANVHGMLTIKGISKPVTLNVALNKMDKNPIKDRLTAGFSASTELKRSDFGMNTLIPSLGDEVNIEIGAEAYPETTKD